MIHFNFIISLEAKYLSCWNSESHLGRECGFSPAGWHAAGCSRDPCKGLRRTQQSKLDVRVLVLMFALLFLQAPFIFVFEMLKD